MADLKAIAEELVNLTVKEVNELATILKDEYGIEPAAAAVAVAAQPGQCFVPRLFVRHHLGRTAFERQHPHAGFPHPAAAQKAELGR